MRKKIILVIEVDGSIVRDVVELPVKQILLSVLLGGATVFCLSKTVFMLLSQ